jgi:hypothetical protein
MATPALRIVSSRRMIRRSDAAPRDGVRVKPIGASTRRFIRGGSSFSSIVSVA